jgi:hypothetical protein
VTLYVLVNAFEAHGGTLREVLAHREGPTRYSLAAQIDPRFSWIVRPRVYLETRPSSVIGRGRQRLEMAFYRRSVPKQPHAAGSQGAGGAGAEAELSARRTSARSPARTVRLIFHLASTFAARDIVFRSPRMQARSSRKKGG